jgi:hypothetical protein
MSTLLKAIRATCPDCSCGSPGGVRQCPITRCALHPYRMGVNPSAMPRGASFPGGDARGKKSAQIEDVFAGNRPPEGDGPTLPRRKLEVVQ